jgi:hypothetical protein
MDINLICSNLIENVHYFCNPGQNPGLYHPRIIWVDRASDRGRIGIFCAFKMQKTHWRLWDVRYVFTKKQNKL